MKKRTCIWILVILLVSSFTLGAAFFSVNEVRSMNNLQGAEMGLSLGPIAATAGVDALYLHGLLIDTTQMNMEENVIVKADGALVMPTVGVKLFLGRKPVRLFVKGTVFKVLPMFDISVRVDNQEVVTEDIVADVQNTLDAIELYGGKVGLGADYRLNDHISLFGETGMRYYLAEVDVLDVLGIGYTSNILSLEALVGSTYTSLGVSFYF